MLKLLPQVLAGLFPVPLPNLAMIQQSLQNLGTKKRFQNHETFTNFPRDR